MNTQLSNYRPPTATRAAELLLCVALPILNGCDSHHAGPKNETAVVDIPDLIEAVRIAGQKNGRFSESECQLRLAAIINGFARDLKVRYGETALTDNAAFDQINFEPIAAAALKHGMILSYFSSFVKDNQTGNHLYQLDISLLKIGSEISPPPNLPLAVNLTVPNARQPKCPVSVLEMSWPLRTPGANTPVGTVVVFKGEQRILLDLEAIKQNASATEIDSKHLVADVLIEHLGLVRFNIRLK